MSKITIGQINPAKSFEAGKNSMLGEYEALHHREFGEYMHKENAYRDVVSDLHLLKKHLEYGEVPEDFEKYFDRATMESDIFKKDLNFFLNNNKVKEV